MLTTTPYTPLQRTSLKNTSPPPPHGSQSASAIFAVDKVTCGMFYAFIRTFYAIISFIRMQMRNLVTLALVIFIFSRGEKIFSQGMGVGINPPISTLHVYENTANTGTTAGLTIEQNGAGNPILQYLLTGSTRWMTGIDKGDANKFKIAGNSTSLATNTWLTIQTTGEVGIGINSPASLLHVAGNAQLGTASTTTGTLKLYNAGSAGATGLQAGSGANGVTYVLPSVDGGSGNQLTTNGAGVLTWSASGGGGGFPKWNEILTPTVNFALSHSALTTTMDWNTITTGTAWTMSSTSLSSGTLFSGTSSATAFTGTLGQFSITGNNAANTGTVFKASSTGASNAGTVAMISNAGTGLSLRVNDDGTDADATPFVVDNSGNVGIGTTTPATTLDANGVINAATGYRIANAASSGKILIGNGTNFIASTPTFPNTNPANGQLLIGNGTNYALGTLTAGSGIDITNGAGSITVANNIPVSEVASATNITTTSTSYVLVTGMSISAPSSGDYMIFFSAEAANSQSSRAVYIAIFINGVEQTNSDRFISAPSANNAVGIATQLYATGVTSGQTIEVKWKVESNTGTMDNRSLTIMRVK